MSAPPTIQPDEYAEVLEQTDAGIRLALPQFAERVGIAEQSAPAPDVEVDAEVASLVGADLTEARQKVLDAGVHLDLEGNVDLHLRLNALVNEIDQFGAILAERHSS